MTRERCSISISYYFDGDDDDGDEISELDVLEQGLVILFTLCGLPHAFGP